MFGTCILVLDLTRKCRFVYRVHTRCPTWYTFVLGSYMSKVCPTSTYNNIPKNKKKSRCYNQGTMKCIIITQWCMIVNVALRENAVKFCSRKFKRYLFIGICICIYVHIIYIIYIYNFDIIYINSLIMTFVIYLYVQTQNLTACRACPWTFFLKAHQSISM